MAASGSRTAKVELKTSAAGMDRGLNDAKRKLRSFAREEAAASRAKARQQAAADKKAARAAKDAQRRTIGFGHSVVAGLGAAAGFDLAGGIGSMVSEVFDVEKELTRFGIDAGMSAQQMAEFRASLMATSEATGQSRLNLAKMAHGYQILTGDAKGAASNLQLFAEVANATGATGEDIAATAAALHNMKLDPSQMRGAFDILVTQGHQGAIEIRDLAGQLSSLQPMFAAFAGGKSVHGIAELGAAAQVMRKNFGSAEEMATGFRGAMSQLMSPAIEKKLKAAGANILHRDPKTKKMVLNDWQDIIKSIKDSKLGNDQIGLRGVFTNIRAFRAIQAAVDNYEEMARLAKEAEGSNQVAVDNQKYMESSTGRIAIAWEHVKNSIANAFTPERIEAFAGAIEKTAKFLVDSVGLMDRLLNGPGKEEGAGDAAREFVELSNNGDPNAEARQVTIARAVLESKPGSMEDDIGTQRFGSLAAYQEGARRFLKSEGADLSNWADTGGQRGGVDPIAMFKAAAGGQLNIANIAKQIGLSVAEALRANPPIVKADSNAIAKVGANAHIHATRPGGRR